jgi:hypothetical protein
MTMTTQILTYTNEEMKWLMWAAYKTRTELLVAARELVQFRHTVRADESYLIKLCDAKSRVIRNRLKTA